jgi:hypothetical protein
MMRLEADFVGCQILWVIETNIRPCGPVRATTASRLGELPLLASQDTDFVSFLNQVQNHGPKRCSRSDHLPAAHRLEAANGTKGDALGDFPVKFVRHLDLAARIHKRYAQGQKGRRCGSAANVAFLLDAQSSEPLGWGNPTCRARSGNISK